MPFTTKQRSIAVPEDLLPQLQRWIADQLRSLADPPVSLATPEATSQDAVELARPVQTSDLIDNIGDGRKSASNIIAMLEKLRLICEQHLSATDSDEALTGPNVDETSEKADSIGVESKRKDITTTKEDALAPIEQQWQELKEQMFQRCAERVNASRAEDAAYEAVLRFAEDHGDRARELAGEWIDVAAASAELNKMVRELQTRWIERSKAHLPSAKPHEESQEEKETREKQQQAFRAAARAHASAEHEEWLRLCDESPGYHAVHHWDASEPCDKWAGPRQDLRLVHYCEVCGLTGVDRTDDCPNYSQHHKWLDGLLEMYTYP